jgi:hypothetical protein
MKPFTWQQIYQQFNRDLIGKDSYRGITLTYAWLATNSDISLLDLSLQLCYISFLIHQTLVLFGFSLC